jgi:predicted nucleic acid-binding protein
MPPRIALDTSFVVGLIDDKDVWRDPAVALQKALEEAGYLPVIFDCVLSEVVSTLARRTHEKRRPAVLPDLLAKIRQQFPTKSIVWVYPDLPQRYEEVFEQVESTDGELNFNDALITISCLHRGIRYLASFDTDFDRIEQLTRIADPSDLKARYGRSPF